MLHETRPGDRMFLLLTALFVAALVSCNLIANKFVAVRLPGFDEPFKLSAGVPYPVTFLVTDILSEIYGKRRANQVVVSGFVASVFVLGVLALGDVFPAIPTSPVDDAEYTSVFSNAPRIIFASMLAYLSAQLVDIRLFHFWKRVTDGRHLWLRNNASTITSQLLDTTLVVTVVFAGRESFGNIAELVWHGWLFKLLVALADTPFAYLAIGWLRRTGVEPAPAEH